MQPHGSTHECAPVKACTPNVPELGGCAGAGGGAQRRQQGRQLRAHRCRSAPQVRRHLLGARACQRTVGSKSLFSPLSFHSLGSFVA